MSSEWLCVRSGERVSAPFAARRTLMTLHLAFVFVARTRRCADRAFVVVPAERFIYFHLFCVKFNGFLNGVNVANSARTHSQCAAHQRRRNQLVPSARSAHAINMRH